MTKEVIVAKEYKFPLKESELVGISKNNGIPYNRSIF
jgi:hypothetical protein